MNINQLKQQALGHNPCNEGGDSDGGGGYGGYGGGGYSAGYGGSDGGDSSTTGGSDGSDGAGSYGGYTTGSSENVGATPGNDAGYESGYQNGTGYEQPESTGLTAAELNDAGFGDLQGMNPENLTQSAAEMVAAQNLATMLGYAPMIASAAVPGYGLAMGLAKMANTAGSFGDVAKGVGTQAAVNALAQALGIPSSLVSGLVNGNIGKGVGDTAVGLGTSALASAFGVPSAVVGAVGNMTGLSKAVGSNIAGAVNAQAGDVNSAMSGFMGSKPTAGALTQTARANTSGSQHAYQA